MKRIFLIVGLILMSFSTTAQSKIGTIDADYIISQMPEMTEVNKSLETYGKELQTEMEANVTKYESLVKAYQSGSENYSEEEKRAKETEIISLENDIKGFRQKATVMMQMRRNELTEPLYTKINEAMLAVISEEGFTQIIHAGSNALAFSAEGFDITEKVMGKLGIQVTE